MFISVTAFDYMLSYRKSFSFAQFSLKEKSNISVFNYMLKLGTDKVSEVVHFLLNAGLSYKHIADINGLSMISVKFSFILNEEDFDFFSKMGCSVLPLLNPTEEYPLGKPELNIANLKNISLSNSTNEALLQQDNLQVAKLVVAIAQRSE